MFFSELSEEEVLSQFQELCRFEPFWSDSGNCWMQYWFGMSGEFYVKDQVRFRENPDETTLSEAENVKMHWPQDATERATELLRRALNENRITQETYDAHACEDVYLDCAQGDSGLREHLLTCPKCGHEFSIFTPALGLPRGKGFNVDCPLCNSLHLNVNDLAMYDAGNAEAPLRLNQVVMGGGYINDFYCLYPQVEGESVQNRKARLVALVADSCADVALPEDERVRLIGQLYDRNQYVLHVAKNVLDEVRRDPQQRKIIQEIEPTENGNMVLQRFGINVMWSASTIQPSVFANGPILLNSMNAEPKPEPVKDAGPKRFCPKCGALSTGKFCPECGTLL